MPPEKKSSVQDFFDNLPDGDKAQADIFASDAPKPAEKPEGDKGSDDQDDDGPRKNRRHRRLEAQLEKEISARIRAEERASALEEFGSKSSKDDKSEVDRRLVQIFGNEKPESIAASHLFQELISDYSAKAKNEAIKELEERQNETRREQAQFESFIDSELESIEDEFNVDVTSDAPAARKARREFLETVQNLSPKNESGDITGYADFSEAWKMYQLKRGSEKPKETADRQKDLASRSMEKSGGSAPTKPKGPTPGFFGWKKDLNL